MRVPAAVASLVCPLALSACLIDADITMSASGNHRVFTVTSGGQPACIQGMSLYAASAPTKPLWAINQSYRANPATCRSSFALGEPAPAGYETAVALTEPVREGEYRTEANGVGWSASKSWRAFP